MGMVKSDKVLYFSGNILNISADYCSIIKVYFVGFKHMKKDLKTLKEKLDFLLNEKPLTSPEALELSREIDILILEYYKNQKKWH